MVRDSEGSAHMKAFWICYSEVGLFRKDMDRQSFLFLCVNMVSHMHQMLTHENLLFT